MVMTAQHVEATAVLRAPLPAPSATMLDFLQWVARRPRTYAETMAAWQSHCPRFTTWEDALADGLVRVVSSAGTGMDQAGVALTERGRAALMIG